MYITEREFSLEETFIWLVENDFTMLVDGSIEKYGLSKKGKN